LIVYFDTSAFVTLFLPDEETTRARLAWDLAPATAVSLVLYAEARSALAAARRHGGAVSVADAGAAIGERLYESHVVTPTYRLVHDAGGLAEVRALRGFDAVHLASALQTGPETVVVTADKRLAGAALAEGMVVLAV
jgi:predicted nucleic acid-binding protein